MKKAGRAWSLFTAVLLVLCLLPASALAFDEGVWSYEDDGSGGVVVTKYNGTDTIVTVPDTLGGKNVTGMGDSLFTHDDGPPPAVTKVIIPAGVASIDDGAFWECRQLESIDVAAGNPYYNSAEGIVFSEDGSTLIHYPAGKAGTAYSIPAGVLTIGRSAFDHSKNLESITITDNVNTIEDIAFWRCDALKSIFIPTTVFSVGQGVFANCSALSAITVAPTNPSYCNTPDGVLFRNSDMQLMQFPAGSAGTAGSYTVPSIGVTGIAENAFRGCNNLKSISLSGSGVTAVGNCAFAFCEYLESIDLGSVQTLGRDAFQNCVALTDVTIPASVTGIDENAFDACSGLERAYFLGDAPATMSDNAFTGCRPDFTVYYLHGMSGFSNPWYGYPAFEYDPSKPYTVSFDMNGSDDTAPAEQNIYAGVKAAEPNTPERWAYTFGGWYQNSACTGAAWDFSVPVTSNLTLYAKWTIDSYPISYDLGGGEADNPASYTIESAFTLKNPTRAGYAFAGWKGTGLSAPAMTVEILKWSTGARSYTATWTPAEYAITYDLGGGEAANPASYTIESAALALNNPTRYGYNFAGWSGTGISGMSLNVTVPTGSVGDRAYTANWSPQTQSYYLANAYPSCGYMNRPFSPTVTSYKITIGENDASFTLTPVKEFDGATMTINKQARPSFPVNLANGKSAKITVKVTLGRKSKTYTFTVTRAKSSNNALASLTATAGTWSQGFDPNVLNYTLTLDENTKSATIKAVAAAGKAARLSPSSKKISLNNGQSRTVKITVKAQSGARRTYTITVVRAPSTNADLKSLKASGLIPKFSPGQTNYTVTLPANKSSISISAKAAGYKAAVYIDGLKKSSKKVTLANGQSAVVRIVVTAQAGNTKEYDITVNRQ